MRIILFTLATCLLFISCKQDSADTNSFATKVNELERRLDSFQLALQECHANKSTSSFGLNLNSPNKKTNTSGSGQCNGITKNGKRCKRTVKSGLYCYQH